MSYVTVEEVQRAYGANPPDEGTTLQSITTWTQFIDRICRQWFEPRQGTFVLDGTGTPTLFLPVPIVAVTALYINNDFVNPVNTEYYRVYSGAGFPDDRRDPKIALVGVNSVFGPYESETAPIFGRGKQNVKIVGSFGFVESDGSTPALISRACLQLAIRDLRAAAGAASSGGSSGGGSSTPVGPISAETTDGHTIRYATTTITGVRIGTTGITGDQQIDGILALYRGPALMAVSASAVWQREV